MHDRGSFTASQPCMQLCRSCGATVSTRAGHASAKSFLKDSSDGVTWDMEKMVISCRQQTPVSMQE